ncbi:MAG: histidine phosphatase family protein [Candidatus Daviesbacteria bacterium]|nr:histidine phosphatase family protein [Candidatus Daviesbacteria bacterium]
MVTIIFESHATTFDNENHLASGHNDVELSSLGIQQAKELGQRYENDSFDAIFCSNLQRSYKTAEIAFGDKFPIIKDKRLRECDYGNLTRQPSSEVDPAKVKHITDPFPNGESYKQTSKRMKEFLDDLKKRYDGPPVGEASKKVMIIGHRATQYGLEYWINGISLKDAVTAAWKWQPGWIYQMSFSD